MKISELMEEFLSSLLKEKGLSSNTERGYRNDLEHFQQWLDQKNITEVSDFEKLKPGEIRAFWASRRNGGISAQSMRRGQSALRSLCKYAVRHKIISHNPADVMDSPKPRRPLPKALSENTTDILMNAPNTDTLLGLRDKAILEMLYGSGLRVSEAASLTIDELDLSTGTATITGKGAKTRVVPMTPASCIALKNYLNARNADPELAHNRHVFISHTKTPLTTRSIARMINKYVMQSALMIHVSPHQFRHSFATDMLNHGADIRAVQDMLGHANLSTTQIYTRISKENLMRTYAGCHPRAVLDKNKKCD